MNSQQMTATLIINQQMQCHKETRRKMSKFKYVLGHEKHRIIFRKSTENVQNWPNSFLSEATQQTIMNKTSLMGVVVVIM